MEHENRIKGVHDCGYCKFFANDPPSNGEVSEHGWCKKRPHLRQKHDDRVHVTNWCQYWEEAVREKITIEVADRPEDDEPMQGDGYDAMDAAVEDRFPDKESDEFLNYKVVSARVEEAMTFHQSLKQLRAQLQEQAIAALTSGSDNQLFEVRGMLKMAETISQSVEVRIGWLHKQLETLKT